MSIWNQAKSVFSGALAFGPSREEVEDLLRRETKLKAKEVRGRLVSSGGEYLSKPIVEDKLAATKLLTKVKPRQSITLIGYLQPMSGCIALFFRGQRIDTLTPEAEALLRAKPTFDQMPVRFKITHVVSNKGDRAWPSLEIEPSSKWP